MADPKAWMHRSRPAISPETCYPERVKIIAKRFRVRLQAHVVRGVQVHFGHTLSGPKPNVTASSKDGMSNNSESEGDVGSNRR